MITEPIIETATRRRAWPRSARTVTLPADDRLHWMIELIVKDVARERRRYGVYVIEHVSETDTAGEPLVVYVGKTSNAYRRRHCVSSAAVVAMGEAGLLRQPRVIAEGLTEAEANDLECATIARYGRKDLGLGPLLNRSDGGAGVRGLVMTPEHRARISAGLTGKVPSDETRAKLSASRMGKTHVVSDKTRAKISAAWARRRAAKAR